MEEVKRLCNSFCIGAVGKWDYTITMNSKNEITEVYIWDADREGNGYTICYNVGVVFLKSMPSDSAIKSNKYLGSIRNINCLLSIMNAVDEYNGCSKKV